MEERNDDYYDKEFIKMVLDSGYRTDKEDFVLEVLTALYEYMSAKTNLPPEELTLYIDEVTKLVGPQHVQTLSIDEMVDWINWVIEQRGEK
jgi:uncharacterized protein YfkK (UPF0435 family)